MQQSADNSVSLVKRILSGDRDAEGELVQKYQRAVQLLLLKRTGNSHLAKDLSQDTFVVVLRKLRAGDVQNPASLAAFIRQVAVNISIQYFRSEKRYVYGTDGIIELHAAPKDDKEKNLDSRTTRAALERVLESLSTERDRELLRRYYLCEEGKDELCSALDLTAAHFDRVLYRAKRRVRELIDEQQGLKSMLFGGLLDG